MVLERGVELAWRAAGRKPLGKHDLLLLALALLDREPLTPRGLLAATWGALAGHYRLRPAQVFIALSALEEEGLVEATTSEGRPRYRLTAEGEDALRRRAQAPVLASLAREPAPPATEEPAGLEQVAVLFTDVVDSTELLDRHGEAGAHGLLRRHFALLRAAVGDHGGREVKSLGDGLMVVFEGAGSAVECALAMQRGVAAAEDPLELRVGIASGEAVCDEADYFGRPVIVARRLCDAGRAGDILVADATRRLVPSLDGARAEPLGDLQLKGLSEPVAATAMRMEPQAAES